MGWYVRQLDAHQTPLSYMPPRDSDLSHTHPNKKAQQWRFGSFEDTSSYLHRSFTTSCTKNCQTQAKRRGKLYSLIVYQIWLEKNSSFSGEHIVLGSEAKKAPVATKKQYQQT